MGWHNRTIDIQKTVVTVHLLLAGQGEGLNLPPEIHLADIVEDLFALLVSLGASLQQARKGLVDQRLRAEDNDGSLITPEDMKILEK